MWLEVMRDKQCEEKPCELGVFLAEHQRAQGRLPGLDPHPAGDRPDRQGPLPRRARADGGQQPAARRHRTGVPAGAAVPGRLPAEAADRDRPAGVVPARAREARQPRRRRRAVRRRARPVGGRGQAAGGHRRLGPVRAHQRLPAVGRGLPGDGLRGVPRARRRAALRHPGVPAAQRAHRRRGRARSGCSAASSSRTSSSARPRRCRTCATPASGASSWAPAPGCRGS